MPLEQTARKNFLSALLSGEYKQTFYRLGHREKSGSMCFCAVGLLCWVNRHDRRFIARTNFSVGFLEVRLSLPAEGGAAGRPGWPVWIGGIPDGVFGLTSFEHCLLIDWNDHLRFSFPEIAHLVSEKIPEIEVPHVSPN